MFGLMLNTFKYIQDESWFVWENVNAIFMHKFVHVHI